MWTVVLNMVLLLEFYLSSAAKGKRGTYSVQEMNQEFSPFGMGGSSFAPWAGGNNMPFMPMFGSGSSFINGNKTGSSSSSNGPSFSFGSSGMTGVTTGDIMAGVSPSAIMAALGQSDIMSGLKPSSSITALGFSSSMPHPPGLSPSSSFPGFSLSNSIPGLGHSNSMAGVGLGNSVPSLGSMSGVSLSDSLSMLSSASNKPGLGLSGMPSFGLGNSLPGFGIMGENSPKLSSVVADFNPNDFKPPTISSEIKAGVGSESMLPPFSLNDLTAALNPSSSMSGSRDVRAGPSPGDMIAMKSGLKMLMGDLGDFSSVPDLSGSSSSDHEGSSGDKPPPPPSIFDYKPLKSGKDLNQLPAVLPPGGKSIEQLQEEADFNFRKLVFEAKENSRSVQDSIKKLKDNFGIGTIGYKGYKNPITYDMPINLGTHNAIELGTSIDYNELKARNPGKLKLPVQTVKLTKTLGIHIPEPYPVKLEIPIPQPYPVPHPVPVPHSLHPDYSSDITSHYPGHYSSGYFGKSNESPISQVVRYHDSLSPAASFKSGYKSYSSYHPDHHHSNPEDDFLVPPAPSSHHYS